MGNASIMDPVTLVQPTIYIVTISPESPVLSNQTKLSLTFGRHDVHDPHNLTPPPLSPFLTTPYFHTSTPHTSYSHTPPSHHTLTPIPLSHSHTPPSYHTLTPTHPSLTPIPLPHTIPSLPTLPHTFTPSHIHLHTSSECSAVLLAPAFSFRLVLALATTDSTAVATYKKPPKCIRAVLPD